MVRVIWKNIYLFLNQKCFTVAITMFGITTPCVSYIQHKLTDKYGDNINVLVFHATGVGGDCMEYLVNSGYVDAVIDLTTTEIADFIVGGVLPCTQYRLDASLNIPTIISLGALNVVNFGDVVPEQFEDRIFHVHNEAVTLMKANDNELKNIASFISNKINNYQKNNVKLVIPNKGISALDAEDSHSVFKQYTNDVTVLTNEFKTKISNPNIIKSVDAHINDSAFGDSVIAEFEQLLQDLNVSIRKSETHHNIYKKVSKYTEDDTSKRKQVLKSLYDQINNGIPIIGAGAGTGISAKCEVMGGADMIIIYNSGKYRMAGHGSLAGLLSYGDANKIVMEMGTEVIPIVNKLNKNIPVLAGINGTDPFRDMDRFLNDIKSAGFDGIQNFPTVGLIDGTFRKNMEETGFGYHKEIELMKLAKKYDLLTTPYVFTINEAIEMTKIGCDIIVIHLGLTTGGNIGAKTTQSGNLMDSLDKITNMANAIYSINKDTIVLVHGGPVSTPKDVEYVFNNLPKGIIDGFYGASSMERLPVEESIANTVKQFKSLKL